MVRLIAVSIIGALVLCSSARADPCEGKLPTEAGTVFTGKVKYIVDGDGLCVGSGEDGATWIEVRTIDFSAPELNTSEGHDAKRIISDLALGKDIACVTTPGRNGTTFSWDRVHATCQIDGVSLAAMMRGAGAPEGGH